MPLKKLFKSASKDDSKDQKAQQLTIAILLFRLIRSDGQANMLELVHMSELLRKEFALSQQELEMVFKLADDGESTSTSTEEFIGEVCANLDNAKRIKLLEYLWILAFADDKIEKSEATLIRSVAKHLQLSELEQVKAQENAEKHLGLDIF